MNILVVNDDGIQSPGIRALVKALSGAAEVYVSAPAEQQSGRSQAITLGKDNYIYIDEEEVEGARRALSVRGTPADCTKVGIQVFGEDGIWFDLVFSGINIGSNLGKDTLYSGTVGAAMEAALSGIRAAAVSVDSHEATHFGPACQLSLDLIPLMMKRLTPDTVVSLNVPDLPAEEIRGVKTAALGGRYYVDWFHEQKDGGYMLEGEPLKREDPDAPLDINALAAGYACITPLHFDYTEYRLLRELETWGMQIRK